MSIYVEGALMYSCSYAPVARTRLRPDLVAWLGAPRASYLVTTQVGPLGGYSFNLSCDIVDGLPTSVVLGLDWGAYLRESLLAAHFRLDHTFDPWIFLTYPGHPLSSMSFVHYGSVPSQPVSAPSGVVIAPSSEGDQAVNQAADSADHQGESLGISSPTRRPLPYGRSNAPG
ncbi:hypothetical protein C8R43DRAFT_1024809 [Mycena crocata]|nr:hypothetical protein C8R43DRAFT_1024809 [Mycena crocata]